MNTIVSRLLSAGLLFLLIFLSGFWLSRSGKPYPGLLFTAHKLVALGTLIFLSIQVFKAQQSAPLPPLQMIGAAFAVVCLVAAIITGGLASVDKTLPAAILKTHQIAPYLGLISAGLTLYRLP